MSLYQRLLGHPFVYDYVRPLAVGGIDMSPFYERLAVKGDDVVVDVGCGTGDALRYLSDFRQYVGFDTDEVAIAAARRKHAQRPRVRFVPAACTEPDIAALAPSRVALSGLLHHLRDDEALALLGAIGRSPGLRRVATADIVYLDGEPISNALARMDRGRYCRTQQGYHDLVARSGLRLTESVVMRSHPKRGIAKYLLMTLEP